MKRRAGTGLVLVTGWLLTGAQFRGCSAEDRPPADVPLPSSTGGCLIDEDCVSDDMCVALRCVEGTCVDAGAIVDDDGDRYAPVPCGEDCDDGNASVFPGSTEQCDGIDQDCDGLIDEGAPGIRANELRHPMNWATIVGLDAGYLVVGTQTIGGDVIAFVVGEDGAAGPVVEVEAGAPDRAPIAAARDAAVITVVVGGGDAEPRLYELTLEGDTLNVGGASSFTSDTGVTALDVALFGGQRWVVLDRNDGTRFLLRDVIDRIELNPGEGAPYLASDGGLVAVTDGDDVVRFFGPDGADRGAQTLPGAFSFRGLASGDGVVYACYRDAFDHAVTRVTPDGLTSPVTAPFGDANDQVSVFFVPPRLMVTRLDDARVGAWLFDGTLMSYEATFEMSQISPTGSAPRVVSAGVSGSGLGAIHASYPVLPSSSIALLECR